jgi:hypothetical protein
MRVLLIIAFALPLVSSQPWLACVTTVVDDFLTALINKQHCTAGSDVSGFCESTQNLNPAPTGCSDGETSIATAIDETAIATATAVAILTVFATAKATVGTYVYTEIASYQSTVSVTATAPGTATATASLTLHVTAHATAWEGSITNSTSYTESASTTVVATATAG